MKNIIIASQLVVIFLLGVFALPAQFRLDEVNQVVHEAAMVLNDVELSRAALYSSINTYRQEEGLQPLKIDNRLETSATWKSKDMVTRNYWAHYVTDAQTDMWNFFISAGYTNSHKGENLAQGYNDTPALIEGWKSSPTHDANLRSNFKDMGIAIDCTYHYNPQNTCLIVLHLGGE